MGRLAGWKADACRCFAGLAYACSSQTEGRLAAARQLEGSCQQPPWPTAPAGQPPRGAAAASSPGLPQRDLWVRLLGAWQPCHRPVHQAQVQMGAPQLRNGALHRPPARRREERWHNRRHARRYSLGPWQHGERAGAGGRGALAASIQPASQPRLASLAPAASAATTTPCRT